MTFSGDTADDWFVSVMADVVTVGRLSGRCANTNLTNEMRAARTRECRANIAFALAAFADDVNAAEDLGFDAAPRTP